MGRLIRLFRAIATAAFFLFFAAGGFAVSYLILPFARNRGTGQRVVRALWRTMMAAVGKAGLVRVDASQLKKVSGRIIVANHPSLIDVVILTAFIPGVYSIAKKGLKRNFFIGPIVRKIMIANDEFTLEEAQKILSDGGNLLIFPEGTRTPMDGEVPKLKRGAAQMAIRLGFPVAAVRIEMSRRILAKGQSIFDMGERAVEYRLISTAEIVPPPLASVNRSAAVRLTEEISKAIFPQSEFRCRRCGACCRIEGFVRLDERDIELISRHLSMDVESFIERETRLAPDRRSLALKDRDDGACGMLGYDNRCRIYPVRPEKCRTFPYEWTNPNSGEYCPGLKAAGSAFPVSAGA